MSKRLPIALAAWLGLVFAINVHAAEAPAGEAAGGKAPALKQAAGKAGDIEDEFSKADANSPGYAHENRGDEYLEQRKYPEAIKEFDAAIALDPKADTAYVKKGIALYHSGRREEAIPLMDKALDVSKRDKVWRWWPLYHKGVAQAVSGDLAAAMKSFDASIKFNPNDRNYVARARTYAQQKQLDKALADARAALKYKPKDYPLSEFVSRLELYAKTQKESDAFLKKMAAQHGAQKTASGLVYFELKKGAGRAPAADDTVKVHYHGTLIDGQVFDSSVERGEPMSFPLTRVIPCWTEALQKMRVGGKARLVCPPDLAYGENGVGSLIPPGAALVFEIELLDIK